MRNILLAIAMALLPVASVLAEPSGHQKPDKSANPERLLPVKRSSGGNACAAFGPGFVKVEGTDTCAKIGGGFSVGAGGSGGGR
jgi:predicted secreted protein